MMLVLKVKHIAVKLLVTMTTIGCILVKTSVAQQLYINETLLNCIPKDFKNFSRSLNEGQEMSTYDRAYFIPLVTANYSFKVMGSGENPFDDLKLYIDSKQIAKTSADYLKNEYLVQFSEVYMAKDQIHYLEFEYESEPKITIPVSFSLNSGTNWTSIYNQLVKYSKDKSPDKHFFVGDWGSWTPCDNDCGQVGKKSRKRICSQNPLLLSGKIAYEGPSMKSINKSCLSEISCSGVLYVLAPLNSRGCSTVCQGVNRTCASIGHDLPSTSAYDIYEALNITCRTKSHTTFDPDKPIRISRGSDCRGFESISKPIDCNKEVKLERVVCPCAPRPAMPTIVSVENHNATSINISVDTANNSRIQYYSNLEVRVKSEGKVVEKKRQTFAMKAKVVVSGLSASTFYCIEAYIISVNGNGDVTSCYNYTTEGIPSSAPSNITACVIDSTSLHFQWDAIQPSLLNGLLKHYTVYAESLGNTAIAKNTTATNLTIEGLAPFTLYCIKISVWTVVGEGPFSDCYNVTTDERAPSTFPPNVTAGNASSTEINVFWDPLDSQLNGVLTKYNVYTTQLTPNSTRKYEGFTNETSVYLTNLAIYSGYCVQVSASTMAGEGPLSGCFNVSTAQGVPLSPPGSLSIGYVTSDLVNLVWEPILPDRHHSSIGGYRAYFIKCDQHGVFEPYQTTFYGAIVTANITEHLSIFTCFSFRLAGFTTAGEGNLTEWINTTTGEEAPAVPPSGIKYHEINSSSVNITWNNIPPIHANGVIRAYSICRYNEMLEVCTRSVSSCPAKLYKVISDLQIATKYCFKVYASTVAGNGPKSSCIEVTLETAPSGFPRNISASNTSSTSINILWNEVDHSLQNGIIQGYRLFLKDIAANQTKATIVNSSIYSFEVKKLKKYHNYWVQIQAYTSKGYGPLSPWVNVTTDEDVPSVAPQSVKILDTTSTRIYLGCAAIPPENLHGILLGYNVYIVKCGEPLDKETVIPVQAETSGTQFGIISLIPNTCYYFCMAAYTIRGEGNISEWVNGTTLEDVPVGIPQNILAYNTSSTSLNITWNEVLETEQNGVILGYIIYHTSYSPNQNNVSTTFDASTFYLEVTMLEKFSSHCIQILAFNSVGKGPLSACVNVSTDEDVPSIAPQIKYINTTARITKIAWKNISQEHHHGILLGTRIYRKICSSSIFYFNVGIQFGILLASANPNTCYLCCVAAYTRIGVGPWSDWRNCSTLEDVPDASPQGITAYNTSSTSVNITWGDVPVSNQNGVILGYKVFWKDFSVNQTNGLVTVDVNTHLLEITELRKFTLYCVQVVAFSKIGDGDRGACVNVTTAEDRPDEPPSNLLGRNLSSSSLEIKWQPPLEINGKLSGYAISVYRYKNESSIEDEPTLFVVTCPLNTSKIIENLYIGHQYCVKVTAFTRIGIGNWSECSVVKLNEDVPSSPPSYIKIVDKTATSFRVIWNSIYWQHRNGVIRGYTLIIKPYTELPSSASSSSPLSTTLLTSPPTSSTSPPTSSPPTSSPPTSSPPTSSPPTSSPPTSSPPTSSPPTSSPPTSSPPTSSPPTSSPPTSSPPTSSPPPSSPPPSSPPTSSPPTSSPPTSSPPTSSPPTSSPPTSSPPTSSPPTSSPPTSSPPTSSPATSSRTSSGRRRRSISSVDSVTVGPDVRSYLFQNLDRNKEYCVEIFGFTSVGEGIHSKCLLSRTYSSDNIIPKITIKSGSTSVQVELNIANFSDLVSSGFLKSYEVQYKIKSVSGVPVDEESFTSKMFNATTQMIVISGLSQYASYIFQAAVITATGRSNFTQPVVFETCHCPHNFYTNWYAYPPFTKTKNNSEISGIIPSILNDIMRTACGFCDLDNGSAMIDYYNDIHGNRESMKDDVDAMKGNITASAHMSFPLSRRNKELKYQGTYVPLLYIPGLLVINKNESSVERYARFVAGSIYDIWPVIVINAVTMLLAGTVIWLLERESYSEHFPVSTFKGISEGTWWAFITMTTLGYGDRFPITRAGRIFAIVWALIGICFTCIMIGSICSSLTVTVVEEYGVGVGRGTKIGVKALTQDFEVANEVCRGFATVEPFPSIDELVNALMAEEVDSIIVDHFTAQSRTDLFNGTWYKVSSIVQQPFTYGVLLTGEATKLERYFKEYTATNVSKVIELAAMVDMSEGFNKTADPLNLVIETATINFLDPTSSIFGKTYLVFGLILLVFFLFGLSYQLLVVNKKDKKVLKAVQDYNERLTDLKAFLQEFHSHFTDLNSQLKRDHSKKLRRVLLLQKRKLQKNTQEIKVPAYVERGSLYIPEK